jgi:prepilin-type N-terminal cleavage/methylation domain-containing protein
MEVMEELQNKLKHICMRIKNISNKQKQSFTLVELMIVIAILAILSAIVIFALNPARLFDNFRDSRRVTDITTIHKAIIFMES